MLPDGIFPYCAGCSVALCLRCFFFLFVLGGSILDGWNLYFMIQSPLL